MSFLFISMASQPVISLASLSTLCTLCSREAQTDRENAGSVRNDMGNLMVALRNTVKLNILEMRFKRETMDLL